MDQDDNELPEADLDELDDELEVVAPGGVHEVLRCTRGDETRVYNLSVVPGGAELWRVTESPGEEPRLVKESHFTSAEEASRFLEEVRRALIAGGWRQAI